MSTVYNLEPPPTAKAVLHTTQGELEIEIFAKQVPLAARSFLQHCLDGYYDGTIFHRLVPGFILQGGDPTATGEGGESALEGGGTFADEIHSRLKFNRRGLLGMANGGQRDDNGSQFFFTLAPATELTGKHTMFGRIAGDTIYNLMKMADAELVPGEGSDRPLYPARITSTEVLLNPFEDMAARTARAKGPEEEAEAKPKKVKKRKGEKALLSFGGDDGDEAEAPVLKKPKFNPKLVAAGPEGEKGRASKKSEAPKVAKSNRRRSTSPLAKPSSPPPAKENRHRELQLPLPDEESPSRSESSSPEPEQVTRVSTLLDRTNAQIKELKASMKRDTGRAEVKDAKPKSALEQMMPSTAVRGRKRKQNGTKDEAATLKALSAFREKLEAAPASAKTEEDKTEDGVEGAAANANTATGEAWDRQPDEEAAEDADGSWMSHALSFAKDRLGKDLTWKKKNEEELVVIDPREKAKELAAEDKAKKAARQHKRNRVQDVGRSSGKAR